MLVGSPRPNTYPALPEPASANVGQRQKRSIDSSPPQKQELVKETVPDPDSGNGYTQITVKPDPGKSVGVGQKAPANVDLGPNTSVDPVTQKISDDFKSVQQEASIYLKNKFAEMAAKAKTPAEKEKWDIDPDNTYIVTYDYNTQGERPYPAKIIKRISLTEALITNDQDVPKGNGYPVAFYPGGPEVIVKPELKTHTPGILSFSRFNPYTEKADTTHTFQGIYRESAEEPALVYNAGNQSALTPDEFRKMIWKADYKKPYDQFLNEFWNQNEKNYPLLSKASLIKAAKTQHQEHSLTKDAHDLVMRALGLSGEETAWPDIKLEDLQKKPPKDPNIEMGMLKVGNFQSTDLMYITDKKVRYDANGNKLPPLTLLYIPGNSSPIHTFNSQAEMKAWFAKQMADPVKREAMVAHFPLKDKPNGYAQAGTEETLTGLGTWPEKRETPGGLLSYDHRAFSGYWDPQNYIKAEPSHSPFDELTKRQKDRSYADAAVDITSDSDVTKKNILSGFEKATKVAMFLTPLAFAMPEVGLALDAFYLASGATNTGIGIDDKIHGKPTGNQRIIFGVFNAATVAIPRIVKAGKAGEGAVNELKAPTVKPGEAPSPPHYPPDTAPPVGAGESTVNRLRPSQWKDISSHVVPEGEQLISGVTPNAKGIYQIKGPNGEDRWMIRITDDAGNSQVHEIDGRFKLSDGYAQIIDPLTKKPVMTVQATAQGEWTPINGPGGIKFPWQSGSSRTQPFDPGAYDYPREGEASSSEASGKVDKRLKQDADHYLKKAKPKTMPIHSDLPSNTPPKEVINSVLQKSPGMIFGEDHTQSAVLRVLMDEAPTFKANNVSLLYSEGFEHSLQPDLDRFFETGEFSQALRERLRLIDRAHVAHEPYTNKNLLLTMRKYGIRVKAIDVPSVEPIARRIKNMNYYAANVIEQDQAAAPRTKWIARVGSYHVFKYKDVQGLDTLTGATGVTVDNAPANVSTSVVQSRDKTQIYIDLAER
ncbi:membrane-targeted effector domain-containing toxin [Pseudomonas sp.]|uniref:membrane-targeted effector domain-containing toxin n=1 Tax=Pseudomonas sp. TaxID=306 RepID=UPI0031B5968A